jgi:hypothetical protein
MLPWQIAPNPAPSLPWQAPPLAQSKEDIRAKLRDFNFYREKFLRVRPRAGGERIPFILNNAQRVLHARIEAEKNAFGMVRALIPKARRMGVSTYVGGRYFHQTATMFGRRAQVVAHRGDSAANLHREIKEFAAGLPEAVRPSIGATNSYELIFDKLKSLYKVASADGGDIGRSDDFHDLHLSEAAFFDNTEDLSSGLLQTVQNLPGTEISMESTGNGQSGMFFNMCEEANRQNNKGPWRIHFLPWAVMPEYRTEVPTAWKAPKDFEEYAKMYGLDREQLYWFWLQNYTIATMNGGQPETIHRLTRQEYPAVYSECFMADSTLDFFPASLVAAAMVRKAAPSAGALKLLCVDPAGDGQDKPFVCDRQGSAIGARVWGELTSRDPNVQSDWLVATFKRFDMNAILVDATGGFGRDLLAGCRLRMRQLGPEKIVGVVFSHGANNEVMYGNRRAELHDKLGRWMQGDVSMPNDKLAQEEAASYKWGVGGCRRDEKARLFMTPKEVIRKAIGRSPDRWDVCAISMAIEG